MITVTGQGKICFHLQKNSVTQKYYDIGQKFWIKDYTLWMF